MPKRKPSLPTELMVEVTAELIATARFNGWTGARLLAEAVKQAFSRNGEKIDAVSIDIGSSSYDETTGRDEYSPAIKKRRQHLGLNTGLNN